MKYRSDIDGLRAVAVLSVIFYHLGMTNVFKTGYIGVDIFFVISGYLITSIIYSQMLIPSDKSTSQFSVLDFYERRIRRILPVFFFVVFSTLVLGYLLLVDGYLNELTNSVFSVIAIGANFHFWADQGYFAIESHFMPLLHMWSLAIEEQFYIIFPLLLAFLVKRKKAVVPILSVLTVLSFIACVIMSFHTSKTAFYWLPFRAWELLLGSLMAVLSVKKGLDVPLLALSKNWQIQALSVFTILLLVFSVRYLEVLTPVFPSYIALFPCIAALLCIELGKNKESIIYKILSLTPFVYIGKISYSLYLWHWVVIVFIGNFIITNSYKPSTLQQIVSLILTFAFSLLTYYFIEQPIRKKKILQKRKTLFISMFFTAVILCLFSLALKENIIPRIWESKYDEISPRSHHFSYPGFQVEGIPHLYKFGDQSKEETLFVIGDSHAQSLYSVLDYLAKENNVSGLMFVSANPLYNIISTAEKNSPERLEEILVLNEQMRNYVLSKDIKATLFALRWSLRMYGKRLDRGMEAMPNNAKLKYINKDKTINDDSEFAITQAIKDIMAFWDNSEEDVDFFYLKSLPEFIMPVPIRARQVERNFFYGDDIHSFVVTAYSDYLKFNQETFEALEFLKDYNVEEIDLSDDICDGEFCYGLNENEEALFVDGDHISILGTMEFRENFLPFVLSGK